MAMKFYFRDMEGYKDLTEHQKKWEKAPCSTWICSPS